MNASPGKAPSSVARRGWDARAFAYRGLAKAVLRGRRRTPCPPPWLAGAMVALAPSAAHGQLARDLRGALARPDAALVRSIARTALRQPDLAAEKMVSHRYRFLWICNPKVASRSLISALQDADPDVELIQGRTLAALFAEQPGTRDYLSFAFVRNPYTRAHSFYADKVRRAHGREVVPVIEGHHGISEASGFDEVCAWLNSPYGADAFADRHWLSQWRQISLPGGRLPDIVGRYEFFGDHLAYIAARLGMPLPELPVLNASAGSDACAEGQAQISLRRAEELNASNRALLQARYAADFERFDYRP